MARHSAPESPTLSTNGETTTLNPRMATDGVGRDRPPLPCVFESGARHRAFGLLGCRRPHRAVRHRGHAAVQAVPARPADAAVPAGADVQKCVRTLDIEEVGKTTRHATFFQMLGNWSFGDYFKEGAIRYAWELLTKSEADGGFGFPEDKLWATILHGDDEAHAIWRNEVGLPENRIQARGLADNYWHMGVPARRPVLGDLLRPRPGIRPRRRPGRRRGPLPRGLEPGLHAGPAEQGPGQGRLRHRGPAAVEEHRHGHGPGADGVHLARRRQPVRDRHHLEDPGPGGRAHRAELRP